MSGRNEEESTTTEGEDKVVGIGDTVVEDEGVSGGDGEGTIEPGTLELLEEEVCE